MTGDELRNEAARAESEISRFLGHPNAESENRMATTDLLLAIARAQADTIDRLERIEAAIKLPNVQPSPPTPKETKDGRVPAWARWGSTP